VRVRYLIGQDATIEVGDRGLAYGDGLFETMAVRHGRIERFELHRERLRLGSDRLGLPLPDADELEQRLAAAAAEFDLGFVKLTVTRGQGPRGYAPPDDPVPNVIINAGMRQPAPTRALRVVTLEQRLGENPKLAGIKHLCRLEQVLGQLELKSLAADEGLMLSMSGAVIGGTSRNVFAVFGSRLVTPDLSQAGIRGVMREAVLHECEQRRVAVDERALTLDDLQQADEMFMTNALVGIQSVECLDERALPSRDLAARLRDALGLIDG
jgi:4-amino-4-deoxychorismate lyase